MNWTYWLPLLVVLTSLVPGVIIFALPEGRVVTRTVLNLTGAVLKIALVWLMMREVYAERNPEFRMPLVQDVDLLLRADALALLFVSLSAFLWLLTTIYAIAYLERSPNRGRFFGFFSICVSATVGIGLAGNLLTFVFFYELLTLSTYPLVVHRGTEASLQAGRVYLRYTIAGGALLLTGAVWLQAAVGPVLFDGGDTLARADLDAAPLVAIFVLLVAGLGVKAALVPLHSWLPVAMVAPAPVSALLHAVAVVKAGAFGIVRVVYDVYGIRLTDAIGVAGPLAVLASITILYGSVQALRQTDLKKRLAYSTVSQVSYITLGVTILGASATIGGIVHLVHQGLMKITLFFCAGNIAETLQVHRIDELDGMGARMPWTMAAFTIAAFGMMGVPPMAGFVTKWYLGLGALEASQPWVIGVLVGSTLLNAAYFLPILHRAWFRRPVTPFPVRRGRLETHWALLMPPLVTAAAALFAGLFASAPPSPLEWARLIAERAYE
ncbi:MAG: proton-conducting transporter membrane subunit [Vicinamibacterales bacterium]|nr:proton-conducting transporter membrane subunit [Vicinamibacterales bacterium]